MYIPKFDTASVWSFIYLCILLHIISAVLHMSTLELLKFVYHVIICMVSGLTIFYNRVCSIPFSIALRPCTYPVHSNIL